MSDGKFRVLGTIGFVNQGVNSSGEEYQMIKVSGMAFFLPPQLRNGWKSGQTVEVVGQYRGDRYSKKRDTYTPDFDIESVSEIV